MVVTLIEQSTVEEEMRRMPWKLSFPCFSQNSHDGSFHDELMPEFHSVLCSVCMSHSHSVIGENVTRERPEFLEAPSSFLIEGHTLHGF